MAVRYHSHRSYRNTKITFMTTPLIVITKMPSNLVSSPLIDGYSSIEENPVEILHSDIEGLFTHTGLQDLQQLQHWLYQSMDRGHVCSAGLDATDPITRIEQACSMAQSPDSAYIWMLRLCAQLSQSLQARAHLYRDLTTDLIVEPNYSGAYLVINHTLPTERADGGRNYSSASYLRHSWLRHRLLEKIRGNLRDQCLA